MCRPRAAADDESDATDGDEIEAAKLLERPHCPDWAGDGLAKKWEQTQELLRVSSTRVPREHLSTLTRVAFANTYERRNGPPCIIDGCEALFENVPSDIEALRQLYGETNFRVSDTHGAMVGLDVWYQYASTTDDDAPFAIYDAEFSDLGGFAYDVPRFLSEDAFARANVDERPPWRWLLLGGPRSGTGVHVDPLYTHAWVYLVQGLKRWIFLPSHLSRDELRELGVGEPQLPSAQWFAKHRDAAAALPGTVELVQRPGELVYVPAGRPHAVLNLDWSYALTHNYAVLSDACVLSTSMEEPEFFDALRGTLPSHEARPVVRASVERWLGPRDLNALAVAAW
jgi:hypothetical protein